MKSRRSRGTWVHRLCLLQALVSHHRGKPLKGSQAQALETVCFLAGGKPRSHPPPDPIELQDEIVQLKKEANAISRERDLERAQRRKLELEMGKKVKQIDDLLSSGHITVSLVRE